MTLDPVAPAQAPEVLRKGRIPRAFFRIMEGLDDIESHIQDIGGMSGGPVFGASKTDGEYRYWLVGLQSSWEPSSRVIATVGVHLTHRVLRPWAESEGILARRTRRRSSQIGERPRGVHG